MVSKKFIWFNLSVSALLMVAGWILPLLTVKVSFDVPFLGRQDVMNETRSMLGTIAKLAEDQNYFPAFLITFFGVLVPVLKTLSMGYSLTGFRNAEKVGEWIFSINKWAMADVFSMSIIIAFLTARGMGNISAEPQAGFYVFTAYVVLSGIGAQMSMKFHRKNRR
jgi:uncharacterized paraquat-inducible protein A